MHGLGELEAAVMDVLWQAEDPQSVRDVLTELAPERTLAYTTVMTVLDKLYRKGWVSRQLVRRSYRYRPTSTREEAASQLLRELLDSTGNPDGVLLHFVHSASEEEFALLQRGLDQRLDR